MLLNTYTIIYIYVVGELMEFYDTICVMHAPRHTSDDSLTSESDNEHAPLVKEHQHLQPSKVSIIIYIMCDQSL